MTCVPAVKWEKPGTIIGTLPGTSFQLFASRGTHFLNYERGVEVGFDGENWEFSASGNVQPFEEVDRYEAEQIRDRVTPDMLERYCRALGIDLFNADFYGPKGMLFVNKGPFVSEAPTMTWDEVRSSVIFE